MKKIALPETPHSIQKGVPLKLVLDRLAVTQLANNLQAVYSPFMKDDFIENVIQKIEPLTLKERGSMIAAAMRNHLPNNYTKAISILIKSLTPPLERTDKLGLSGLFYMPHVSFVALYGLDIDYNKNIDPFDVSMKAQYELTKRFSSEFSIREFLITRPERTFGVLNEWIYNSNPHVRRLCSEGTRPRLPWAKKIQSLVIDPSPSFRILEELKNDPDLYVRRSVANHVGDIAKDNLEIALIMCESWLSDLSNELKWVIRHALRHPAKKGNKDALKIRALAKKN
ncbi:DNA alkylation repair protein [Maribacter sp. HTCC2170]|uniref:DNA alkylation repair protein n=1 Tax=Maribacter sp. (strain HTCC2170 / KCCM 42371) TaxID=313603 RepID=UPI00006AFC60|nr:DNA alkylation repair protein [Maribacter sp. HTCC2170]EAR01461.1 hypothetical protein FB2170_12091 [Maribacter sp. HTCC2170]